MKDPRSAVIAAAVWATALIAVMLPAAAMPMAVVLASTALGWLVVAVRHHSGSGLVILALLACAAVAGVVASAVPGRAAAAESGGRAVEVVGTVASSASTGSDGRLWVDVQATAVGAPGRAAAVSVPARVGIDQQDGVDLGATVRVTGQAKATDAGERAALVVFATSAEVVRPAGGIFAVAAEVRSTFVERATRLPEPGAGLLPGLAVGDTRAVGDELEQAMLASGLSHLTAVSGANCAIVVMAVFWVVALCGGGRGLRVVLSLTALGAFVVLVTPEPSVVRASVMTALAMLSLLLGRPSAGMAMLSLAVVTILLVDPWLAATPGFALSAAATVGLLLLARPLARGLSRWMPPPLALAVAVPLSAQLACAPIIALFSEQQSVVGVFANLLAAPAAPIATVIGLLACLTSPLPPLADVFAAAAWLPSSWIAATAVVSAGLPGATLAVVAGPLSALVVAILSVAAGIAIVGPRRRMLRVSAALVLLIAAGLGGARALLTGPAATLTTPGEWSIAACDVGQGDAIVVRSEGQVALIDTGPEPEPLAACLGGLGIERIDLLVLTHFDLDHAGGVPAVLGRVGAVLHGPPGRSGDERVLTDLVTSGARPVEAASGMQGSLGGAGWRVLWPSAGSVAFPPGNDASVVVEIAGGGVPRSILLGDLSAEPQRMLLSSGRLNGVYPVVKVAHHGSADQEAALYPALRPRVALISVGEGNAYGHPRDETLAIVQASGAQALRTDRRGRILLGLQDGALAIWSDRPAG